MQAAPPPRKEIERERAEILARFARDNHAAAALERTRALVLREPAWPALRMDVAVLAMELSEYALALDAARELLRRVPGDFAAMRCAADAFAFCGREADALAAWGTVTRPGQRATALATMASLAERSGRLDQAEDWARQAMALAPRDAMTVLTAGRIASRRGETDRAIGWLQRCAHTGVPPGMRSQALYELGDIHHRQQDAKSAVAAWRQAKRCLESGLPAQVDMGRRIRLKLLARNRALAADLTPELVRRWRSQAPASELPRLAVLAGHPRSGTTLLEQILAAHPAVCDVDEKDALASSVRQTLFPQTPDGPNLAALDAMPDAALAATRRDYLRRLTPLVDGVSAAGLILDKNPNLTDFLPFLLRPFPEVRLLVARREPRDVLLSCFRLPLLPESGNVAWLREDHAAQDYRSIMAVWDKLRQCLTGDGGWLEISYEALCANPLGEARKATRFLGLDWDARQDDYRAARAGERVASPSHAAVRAPVHSASIGGWRRYADLLPDLFAGFGD